MRNSPAKQRHSEVQCGDAKLSRGQERRRGVPRSVGAGALLRLGFAERQHSTDEHRTAADQQRRAALRNEMPSSG